MMVRPKIILKSSTDLPQFRSPSERRNVFKPKEEIEICYTRRMMDLGIRYLYMYFLIVFLGVASACVCGIENGDYNVTLLINSTTVTACPREEVFLS